MEQKIIKIKRRRTEATKKTANSNIEEWVAYWRANPHRFICDYLGLKFREDFQSVLIFMMDRPLYFIFAASRGLAKSTLTLLYCIMRCILYPDTKIIVVAPLKSQSIDFVRKIYDFIKVSKNLEKEIEPDGIRTGQNDTSITFCNGSKIFTKTFTEGSRGTRGNILIVDEFAMIKDNTILINTFVPMLTSPRSPLYSSLSTEERRRLIEDTRQLYLSSIRSESDWSWGEFLKYLKLVTEGDKNYGILSLPYQLGVKGGYILKSNVEQQFRLNSDRVEWLKAEYTAVPIRSDNGAFFKYEAMQRTRELLNVFVAKSDSEYITYKGKEEKWKFYIPKQEGEIRILSMDIALIESPKNDNTSFWITRLIPNGDRYYKSIAYAESLHGINAVIQGLRAKQIFYEMECDYIAIDVSGVGSGVFDILSGETYDEARGILYPAWTVVNSDDVKMVNRTLSKNAVPCVYAMRTSSLDKHNRFIIMRDMFETNDIHTPASDLEAIDYYNQNYQYYKIEDIGLKSRMLDTFVQMNLLIIEATNLETVISNGLYNLKEKPTKRKDRVMSLCYNLDIVKMKEKEYIASQNQESSSFLDFVFV